MPEVVTPVQSASPPTERQSADAFQNLIDRGLFADAKPAPAAEPAQQTRQEATVADKTGPATAEPVADDVPEYSNLEDYLAKQGLERDSFFALPVRVKVDGREQDVPLSALTKSYGLEQHFQAKSVAFAEQQRQWEAEREQAKQAVVQQFTQAKQLAQLATAQLNAEFSQVDWNKLYAEDPGRFAADHQRFQMRQAAINQGLQQIQQAEAAQQQQMQAAQAQQLAVERDKLYAAVPEWRDQTKFAAEQKDMSSYARTLGFTDAELSSIFDHRYVRVLRDAARFAALQAQSPEKLKQVRAAPVMASPGARVQRNPNVVALRESKAAMRSRPRDARVQESAFEAWAQAAKI